MYEPKSLTLHLVKKVIVILLCALYLASASGTTLSIHFCMGKRVGAEFGHQHREKCPRCGMTEKAKKGCCRDEIKTFKNAEHKAAKTSSGICLCQAAIVPVTYSYHQLSFAAVQQTISVVQKPPIYLIETDLYIRYRNLRI